MNETIYTILVIIIVCAGSVALCWVFIINTLQEQLAQERKHIAHLEAQVSRHSRGELDNLNRAVKAERELTELQKNTDEAQS